MRNPVAKASTPLTALLAVTLVLTGCGGGAADGGSLPTLNLEAAIDNPRPFDLAEIAESIELIPLDDSDTNALLTPYLNIAESKSCFYVMDIYNQPVKVFDKTGTYVATRGSIGRGPGEFLSVSGITTDWEGDNLYVKVNSGVIQAYDASGRMFARTEDVPGGKTVFADGKLLLLGEPDFDAAMWGSDGFTMADTPITILTLFQPDLSSRTTIVGPDRGINMIFTRFAENGQGTSAMINPQIISNNGESVLVKEGRCDTVFRYRNDNTLEAVLRLDLGKHTLPPEAYGTAPTVKMDGFCRVANFWMAGQHTIVQIFNDTADGRQEFLLFDGDEGETTGGYSATGPDDVPGLSLGGVAFTPSHVRDGRLVGYLQALDIVDAAEADAITDPKLKALAATLREDSNPVIVVAELKK